MVQGEARRRGTTAEAGYGARKCCDHTCTDVISLLRSMIGLYLPVVAVDLIEVLPGL
jgi:hypothetical protein